MNSTKKKCGSCGAVTHGNANFCSVCGKSFTSSGRSTPDLFENIKRGFLGYINPIRKKMASYGMYREVKSRAIGGVCACLAKKMRIDVLLLRCIVCSLAWICVYVVPIYFVIWLITEERNV